MGYSDKDKTKGGLAIKDSHTQNRCLLGKFWAKLLEQPSTSWQRWFHRFYGNPTGGDLGSSHRLNTLVWQTILAVLPDFQAKTEVLLGDGAGTGFWHDKWLGPAPLAKLFPALYSHTDRPHTSVQDALAVGAWESNLGPRLSSAAS